MMLLQVVVSVTQMNWIVTHMVWWHIACDSAVAIMIAWWLWWHKVLSDLLCIEWLQVFPAAYDELVQIS